MAINAWSSIRKGLDQASGSLQRSFAALASGKRLTSAASDPAGLAIAVELATTVSISNQASRNVSYAVSASEMVDSATAQLSDMGGRMAELAMQAANGPLSNEQRAVVNQEFQALSQEAQRIVETTEFNGVKLLKGESFSVQVGADASLFGSIMMPPFDGPGMIAGLKDVSLTTQAGARAAIDSVSSMIGMVAAGRGAQGVFQRRVESVASTLSEKSIAATAARARIEDADIAEESANVSTAETRRQVVAALHKRYQTNSIRGFIIPGLRNRG